jgi:tetratricopeptide (TPR) repeat protein
VIQTSNQWPLRGASIELRLPAPPNSVSSGQNAVSLKRLAFRPSAKMRQAFAQALKLSAAGKQAEALSAVENIVKTEPGWFEAWEELGKLQALLGAHGGAVDALRQALSIDPNAATVYPSLGMALVRTRQFSEAGQIAQKGLDLNPDCVKSKFVLGLAMASERQTTARALALLDEVQSHFPEAMVPLAALLLREGQFEASRDAAWRYLHIGRAPRAEIAQSIWREASSRLK